MTVPVGADGVLGLYGAVGDAFAGRRLGFAGRRAALAARFARYRGAEDASVTANWVAGALAELGFAGIVARGDSPPARLYALAEMPLRGAHLIAANPALPRAAADIVRWHREHDDGTGFPDRLRWDGIPADAAALGIVHAYLESVEDAAEPRPPVEALFALAAESGRRFRVELVRAFRTYATETPDRDEPVDPALPALDDDACLTALTALIDARDPSTEGRSERLARRASSLAERLDLDPARSARHARLLALGRAAETIAHDEFDPLSRFAREHRAAIANRAAAIAASVPHYAADAPSLAASAAWFEDDRHHDDRAAAVLALVVAADAIPAADAARRLAAAAGTQLDPEVTRAYVASLAAP